MQESSLFALRLTKTKEKHDTEYRIGFAGNGEIQALEFSFMKHEHLGKIWTRSHNLVVLRYLFYMNFHVMIYPELICNFMVLIAIGHCMVHPLEYNDS